MNTHLWQWIGRFRGEPTMQAMPCPVVIEQRTQFIACCQWKNGKTKPLNSTVEGSFEWISFKYTDTCINYNFQKENLSRKHHRAHSDYRSVTYTASVFPVNEILPHTIHKYKCGGRSAVLFSATVSETSLSLSITSPSTLSVFLYSLSKSTSLPCWVGHLRVCVSVCLWAVLSLSLQWQLQ